MMCVKHRSWKQENEFRILYPATRLKGNGKRLSDIEMGIKMKAIHIGKDCNIRNKKKLVDIARRLKIEIYEMSVNELSSSFDMSFDSITYR
jgi:hypothetical protein